MRGAERPGAPGREGAEHPAPEELSSKANCPHLPPCESRHLLHPTFSWVVLVVRPPEMEPWHEPPTPPKTPPTACASPVKKKTSFSGNVIKDYSPTPQPLAPTGDELPPMPCLPRALSAPPEDLSYLRVQPGNWSPTPQRRKMPERMRRFSAGDLSPRRHTIHVDESKRIRRGSKVLMPGIDPRKEDQTPWFG